MPHNIRLEGIFTLRAPLSHIKESISSTSYLVEESILQPDGGVESVFVYSGNAWRGQLRDLIAAYMLDKLGNPALSLDTFHLLFSGGRIGGTQSTDLGQARKIRSSIPAIALLGGGVGNQILEGKLRFGNCYPLCVEAAPVLPRSLYEQASRVSYSSITMIKEYSRRDDSKIDSIAAYLPGPEHNLLGDGGKKPRARKDDGPADQMRIGCELVIPGVKLRTYVDGDNLSDVELGCLVSGLHRFSRSPYIGGQSARGHGAADLEYKIIDRETGEASDFLSVNDGVSLLAPPAEAAKDAYDHHLRSIYDEMLASRSSEITALLGAG